MDERHERERRVEPAGARDAERRRDEVARREADEAARDDHDRSVTYGRARGIA